VLSTERPTSFRDQLINQTVRTRRLIALSSNLDPFGTFDVPVRLADVAQHLAKLESDLGSRKAPLAGMDANLDVLMIHLSQLESALADRRLKMLRYVNQYSLKEVVAGAVAAAVVEQEHGQDFYNALIQRFSFAEERALREILNGLDLSIADVGRGKQQPEALGSIMQELREQVIAIRLRLQIPDDTSEVWP